MSEYYAVVRSGLNELQHYGVRGMKWGVRKALHKGSEKAMSRQYKKAQKKLDKLNKKADINYQKNEINYHTGKTYRTGMGSIAADIGALGAVHAHKALLRSSVATQNKIGALNTTMVGALGLTGLGLGLLGKETYHAGKVFAARYRTTEKGHAKAVAKRNAWKKEMNSAFKGKYDASKGSLKKKRG